jgi:hypothetical protein
MTPEALFALSGMLMLPGWAALVLSPLFPRLADLVASVIVPAIFAVLYCALIMAFWSGAPGGYDSLSNVMALFTVPELALAGWIHFLAFDLFVGAWIVRTARDENIPFLLVLPLLPVTLMFGPAGFLLFVMLRATRRTLSPDLKEA